MQTLTINARLIFESDADHQAVLALLREERVAWNYCSRYLYEHPTSSQKDLHAACYRATRELVSLSQVAIKARQAALTAYKTIKANGHELENPAVKHNLSLQLDQRLYSYKGGVFSLPSVNGRVRVKPQMFSRLKRFLAKHTFGDPRLFVRGNHIWLSLPFKVEAKPLTPNKVVGIDVGVRRLAATSEGKIFVDRPHNAGIRRIRHLKAALQARGTRSAKKHLKKVKRREHNKQQNMRRHLANQLTKTDATVLAVEDLDVRKMKSGYGKKQTKRTGIALMLSAIVHKAGLAGKRVVRVNPAYTSQTNSWTGERDGVRRGRRYYTGCGTVLDADVNAACNIAVLGSRVIGQSPIPASCCKALDGQAVLFGVLG